MANKFHDLTEIELQTKLPDVKLAIDTKGEENDVFICPETCANEIISFFIGHGIPYTQIDNPKLCPVEEINRQLAKYINPLYLTEDMDELKYLQGVTALITKFDADALFDWSMQILSWDDKDPAYRAYIEKDRQEAEEYYQKYEKVD